jgi:signal transduction histidine kinase
MALRALLRRHGDKLLAGVLAVTMTLELLIWSGTHAGVDRPVAVAACLLSSLPLVARRRSPALVFVLVMVGLLAVMHEARGFDNDSMSLVVIFLLNLYSLGRYAEGTEAWVGAGLLVAEGLLFIQGDVGLTHADPGDVAFTLGFVGAPWGAGLTVRLRRERERFLGAENERLRVEQAEREARAVAEERSRIARELHDVVSHAISVTVLQARGARRTLDSDPEVARRALDAIEQTNTAALSDMRRLLAVLRDTEVENGPGSGREPQPSLRHLEQLTEHVRGSGVPVTVEVVGEPTDVPPGVDLSAYRIVQEALTNVLKHSAGAQVTVTLAYAEEALTVTVLDDGTAQPSGSGTFDGHGLIGIRERVAVVGGEVVAGPRPEGGFRISARLPYALEVS